MAAAGRETGRRGWGGAGIFVISLLLALAPPAYGDASWSFDPPSWDFGTVVPGTGPTPPKAFTLSNTGDVELSAVFVMVGGNEGAGFGLAGNTCGKLAPGASCQISVDFDPSTPGAKEGTLQVASHGGLAPQASVELSGRGAGPELSVAPSTHEYPALPLGAVSPPHTFTVTNTGSLDLTLSWLATVTYIHGDEDQFEVSGGSCAPDQVLAPGGTCTVEVRFAPTRPGPLIGDLLISSDAPGSPHVVTLSGFGIQPQLPGFVLPPFVEPRVSILRRPAKVTNDPRAVFWLKASASAATVACKLDHEQWFKACESPVTYRNLRPGRHRFSVLAFDTFGRKGRPKVFRWRVWAPAPRPARARGPRPHPLTPSR
ncbi:MAG TPA: choice-of-anchor D domain-containing protein [Solirubrobacterales bacterium]|nr:choice-of-anchor D domain-containing protein [Solirubrobacterales bacterium]